VPRPAPAPTAIRTVQHAIGLAHLSMKALAQQAGISVSALEKYQQGVMLPSAAVRRRLAAALDRHGHRLLEAAREIRGS
jgi:transcriptional regulator with XRE-family HTH domain